MRIDELFGFGKIKPEAINTGAEFWIKGKSGDDGYAVEIRSKATLNGEPAFNILFLSPSGGGTQDRMTVDSIVKLLNDKKAKKR